MSEIKIYTVSELSEILKMTPQTVRAYLKAGKIKGTKAGNKWVASDEAVRAFLRGE